jgi:hypothetical protein
MNSLLIPLFVGVSLLVLAEESREAHYDAQRRGWTLNQTEAPPQAEEPLDAYECASEMQREERPERNEVSASHHSLLAEVKAAYFYPTGHLFRKIYSGGGLYGLEASYQTWKRLYLFGSSSYFSKSGTSTAGNYSTRITMVPCALGLKYVYPIRGFTPYLGVAAVGTYLHTHDHSSHVIRSNSKWGFGEMVKIGALARLSNSFFLDFFADYSHVTIHFHRTNHQKVVRHRADLSGYSFGAGLTYRFGSPT